MSNFQKNSLISLTLTILMNLFKDVRGVISFLFAGSWFWHGEALSQNGSRYRCTGCYREDTSLSSCNLWFREHAPFFFKLMRIILSGPKIDKLHKLWCMNATAQRFFSKFLIGGDSIFLSPSVPVGDEAKWSGGLTKKNSSWSLNIPLKLNLRNF